jgi:hypothetical protein
VGVFYERGTPVQIVPGDGGADVDVYTGRSTWGLSHSLYLTHSLTLSRTLLNP